MEKDKETGEQVPVMRFKATLDAWCISGFGGDENAIYRVRKLDAVITSKQENWTWTHVMRVMVDEGILYKPTCNRFDQLICSMIPNKGRDTVRKHGDYESTLAAERSICNQIALEFAPVLTRKIRAEL